MTNQDQDQKGARGRELLQARSCTFFSWGIVLRTLERKVSATKEWKTLLYGSFVGFRGQCHS